MTAPARLAALERRLAAESLADDVRPGPSGMTADEAYEILAAYVADHRERAGLPPLPPPQTPPSLADRLAVLSAAYRLDAAATAR